MAGVGKMESVDTIGAAEHPSESCVVRLDLEDPGPEMDRRYVDMALHSMMQDAGNQEAGEPEPVRLINKRLFRADTAIPLVDEVVSDRSLVIRLLANRA